MVQCKKSPLTNPSKGELQVQVLLTRPWELANSPTLDPFNIPSGELSNALKSLIFNRKYINIHGPFSTSSYVSTHDLGNINSQGL